MSKRKRWSPEYKHELVELVRRSKSNCRKIALEVGVQPALLTRWVREANDLLVGQSLPHVQSPGQVGLDSKSDRYSKPGGRRKLSRASRSVGPRIPYSAQHRRSQTGSLGRV